MQAGRARPWTLAISALRSASVAAEQLHKTLAQRSESRLDSLGVSAWEIASILYLVEAPIEEGQLAIDIRDLFSESHDALIEIRDVRSQVEALTSRLGEAGQGEGLEELSKPLVEKLTGIDLDTQAIVLFLDVNLR